MIHPHCDREPCGLVDTKEVESRIELLSSDTYIFNTLAKYQYICRVSVAALQPISDVLPQNTIPP